jgi:hypothetical protein
MRRWSREAVSAAAAAAATLCFLPSPPMIVSQNPLAISAHILHPQVQWAQVEPRAFPGLTHLNFLRIGQDIFSVQKSREEGKWS